MQAHDITQQFTIAASGVSMRLRVLCPRFGCCLMYTNYQAALKTGQLVKDEHLTLYEAVGALEVRCPVPMIYDPANLSIIPPFAYRLSSLCCPTCV